MLKAKPTSLCQRCGTKLSKDRGLLIFCSGGCRDKFYEELFHERSEEDQKEWSRLCEEARQAKKKAKDADAL